MTNKIALVWEGKAEAIEQYNAYDVSNYELIENKERSIDSDKTNNVIIEGDNLPVLSLLQEEYKGKVKMIYVDPPYNTGNKCAYKDKFWKGRECKHSKWLSMMYPRLKLARELLRDDGVIFVSIDDHEQANLKLLMDEIFGEGNFVGQITRATGTTTGQDSDRIGKSLDYIIIHSKNQCQLNGILLNEKDSQRFSQDDEHGNYALLQLRKTGNNDKKEDRPLMYYPISNPDGENILPRANGYDGCWRVGVTTYKSLVERNLIIWKKNKKAILTPYVKYYLEGRTKKVSNLWVSLDGNKKASLEIKSLFNNKKLFSTPKPIDLVKRILEISTNTNNDIILDFFAGSGTTGHAVMQMNLEEKQKAIEKGEDPELVGNRKYIMVQLPEAIDEKSDAYKAGYKNISDITIDRIKRASNKIVEANPDIELDTSFKVFELTETNAIANSKAL